jgi:isopenicillin-N N-acyltransferase like protein
LKYAPFPLVEIGGRPYERGVAYGRAAVERIGRSVRLYAGQMSGMGFSWDEVRAIVSDFVQPALGRMEIAPMPALNREFASYALG